MDIEDNPIICFIFIAFVVVAMILTPICVFEWIGSGVDTKVYNEHFGTNYTQKEFFFRGETIKSFVNEGKQQTINIKGLTKE